MCVGGAPVLHVHLGFWYKEDVCSTVISESGLLTAAESAGNFRTGGARGWSWGRESYSWILVCKLWCKAMCTMRLCTHKHMPQPQSFFCLVCKEKGDEMHPFPKDYSCALFAMQTGTFYFYLFSLPHPSFIPILFPIRLHPNKEIYVTLLS